MIKHWFKTSLAVAVAAVSGHAAANGLAINEQSASSMGTGFAGRSSSAMDASTVFGNPAGMSKLDRAQVSGGFAVIHAKTDIKGSGAFPGTNDGDMVPFAAVPFGYYVTPLNDDWHFGLGVYVPFGVISDYESSFQGRYHGLKSSVQVVTLQPTLSYKFNDRVSVGFGPTINKIDGQLTRNVLTGAPTGDAKVDVRGDDVAYGYNVGVLVDVTDRLALGLNYRSKVEYELEGRTRVSNLAVPVAPGQLLNINQTYDGSLDFTSPEAADLSATYKLDDQWTLYAGTTWTRWSQLQEIVVENEGVPALLNARLGTITEEQNWSDTWAFAFGTAYQITPAVSLRAGLAFDRSPTTDADRTVRIPVGNRKILSLGAGWDINQDMTLDVAYAYLREDAAYVTHEATASNPGAYNARYRNSAHGLATQLTYRF